MPFGPVNGPSIFIRLIHDWDKEWKTLAAKRGVQICADNNSKIIVDDINSFAKQLRAAFLMMECQFRVCALRCLSLSLPKSVFFPTRFEFVGIDIAKHGNFPVRSKRQLLESW